MKRIYNTYKNSGVNMASADKLVNYISKISRKTYKKGSELKSFKNIGSFGSIFDLSKLKMKIGSNIMFRTVPITATITGNFISPSPANIDLNTIAKTMNVIP